MSRKEELLASFDDAWSHRWESLGSSLEGIAEDIAIFQHAAYANIPVSPDEPPAGTILWHVVHLAQCYQAYTERILLRPRRESDVPAPDVSSLGEAIDFLKRDRAKLRSTIAELREDQLDELLCNGETVASMARLSIRHDVWHAAQITVVKRLFSASLESSES